MEAVVRLVSKAFGVNKSSSTALKCNSGKPTAKGKLKLKSDTNVSDMEPISSLRRCTFFPAHFNTHEWGYVSFN